MKTSRFCIYCGRRANSRDHVPPKCLLERPFPENLSTVPACQECNRGFALDEEYFRVVLASTSTKPLLEVKVTEGGVVDRAFEMSQNWDASVIHALRVDAEDRVLLATQEGRLARVIAKIAAGLYFLRYGQIVNLHRLEPVRAFPCGPPEDQRPWQLLACMVGGDFRFKRWSLVQENVFSSIVVRDSEWKMWCVMNFYDALWGVTCFPQPKSLKPPRRVSKTNDRQLSLLEGVL